MSQLPLQELNVEEQIVINEEYKDWKKQSPNLYDMIFSQGLEWPSLTFQWLPSTPTQEDDEAEDYSSYRALISSNASEREQTYLEVVEIRLSSGDGSKDDRNLKSSRRTQKQENGGKRFKVITRVPHNGEINRARYNPHNPSIVAVKGIYGEVNLFDLGIQHNELVPKSLFKLTGHKSEGYGLMWNPHENGLLLSGANDQTIALWNIEGKPTSTTGSQETQKLENTLLLNYHTGAVEDVAWHRHHKNIFGSCGDDRTIALWDMRFRHSERRPKPIVSVVGHRSEIYSMDFSPFNQYLLITGAEDKEIKLWDIRKMHRSIHSFTQHDKNVLKVQWSPFNVGVLASSSSDRRVKIWDISRIGEGEKKSELLFNHQGHRSKVPDFEWHPEEKLVIGSVEECNVLQVWEMSKSIYYEEENSSATKI